MVTLLFVAYTTTYLLYIIHIMRVILREMHLTDIVYVYRRKIMYIYDIIWHLNEYIYIYEKKSMLWPEKWYFIMWEYFREKSENFKNFYFPGLN